MFKKKIYISLILLLFTSSCGDSWDAFKRGMTGQKQASTDEFLVKKKEPLVMPPKWKNLPEPGGVMKSDDEVEEATDIEELMQLGKNEESSTNYEQGNVNLEESILKKIK